MRDKLVVLGLMFGLVVLIFSFISPANLLSVIQNSPGNNSLTNNRPQFNFTAISDINRTFSCQVLIDNTGYGSIAVINNTLTTVISNGNLTIGNHSWAIKCRDANGTVISGKRMFVASSYLPNPSVPVWGVLHSIHSKISDGGMTGKERVENLERYYDWASTIEHDTQTNNYEWSALRNEANGNNSDGKFSYFVGYEWTGNQAGNAEATIFFKDNGPASKINGNDSRYNTFGNLSLWLQNNNGIGCIAHPARIGNIVNWNDIEIKNESYFPCVEILNKNDYQWNDYWNCSSDSGCTSYANPHQGDSNWGGSVYTALQKGFRLGFVAGWDYHGSYPGFPGDYTGLADTVSFTREEIFETIRKRHTWAAESKILMNVFANNGSEKYIMGDDFHYDSSSQNIAVNYAINASSGKNIVNVSIFVNGIIVNLTRFLEQQNVTSSFNQNLVDGRENYIFIEATQNDGKRAWSSPMYVSYKKIIQSSNNSNQDSSNENAANNDEGESSSDSGWDAGFWRRTLNHADKSFSEIGNLTREIGARERIKIKVNGKEHYIGIVAIDLNWATINVSSTPQQATISIGESKKFDVENDSYFDMAVRVEGIKNSRVNLSMSYIREEINISTPLGNTNQTGNGNQTSAKSSSFLDNGLLLGVLLTIAILIVIFWANYSLIVRKKVRGLKTKKNSRELEPKSLNAYF